MDEFLPRYTGREELDLFAYLKKYGRLVGEDVSFEEALQELRLIRVRYAIEALPWRVDSAGRREDLLELEEVYTLWEDIQGLGLL